MIEYEHKRISWCERIISLFVLSESHNKSKADMLYDRIIKHRNPLIHTFTAAFLPFVVMFLGFIAVFISILCKNTLDVFFVGVILILLGAILTYYIALAAAMIEPIWGKVWINYAIQFAINIIIFKLNDRFLYKLDSVKLELK